jgi:hypothetical protein
LGLVIGKWCFEPGFPMPKVKAMAYTLSMLMGIDVLCIDPGDKTQYIDIPMIGQSLCDVEYSESDITIYTHIPAHPYLWENLDCAMSELGGRLVAGETYWQPQQRFHHLRRPWSQLSILQQLLLKIPAIGASRVLDRFV